MKRIIGFLAALLVAAQGNVFASAAALPAAPRGKVAAVVSGGALYLDLGQVAQLMDYSVNLPGDGTVVLYSTADQIVLEPAQNQMEDRGHTVDIAAESPEGSYGAGCISQSGELYWSAKLAKDCFGLAIDGDGKSGAVQVQRVLQNTGSFKTVKTEMELESLKATIQYPQFSGVGDPAVYDRINSIFRTAAESALAEGKKNAADLQQSAALGYGGPLQCETYVDYAVTYNQNNLLSVVLTDYQYAGGAHGSTLQTAYTFNLRTGAQYNTLADLMKADSGYEKNVSDSIRTRINVKVASGVLDELSDDPFKEISPAQAYFLSDDGLVIFFQQYEHFPYADGIQEFTLPYAQVKPLLQPEFQILGTQKTA